MTSTTRRLAVTVRPVCGPSGLIEIGGLRLLNDVVAVFARHG
jgi:hypothetical protein